MYIYSPWQTLYDEEENGFEKYNISNKIYYISIQNTFSQEEAVLTERLLICHSEVWQALFQEIPTVLLFINHLFLNRH